MDVVVFGGALAALDGWMGQIGRRRRGVALRSTKGPPSIIFIPVPLVNVFVGIYTVADSSAVDALTLVVAHTDQPIELSLGRDRRAVFTYRFQYVAAYHSRIPVLCSPEQPALPCRCNALYRKLCNPFAWGVCPK